MKISRRGFTLAEVLLGAVIFAFVLSGLLSLFSNCIFLNEASRNGNIAVTHAQYVLEELKDADFSDIKTDIDSSDWDFDSDAEIEALGLTPLTAENIDTSASWASGTTLLNVTVQVNWEESGGRQRNISLATQFAQP